MSAETAAAAVPLDPRWFERPLPARGGADVVRALRELAGMRPAAEGRLDVTIEFEVGDECVTLPARQPCEGRPVARVWVAPEHADALLLGDLHEPAELLAGVARLSGPRGAVIATVPALGRLGHAYRAHLRLPPGVNRHEVLAHYRPPPERARHFPWPDTIEPDAAGQALCAALVLLGLPPACRRIEVAALMEAHAAGRVTRERMAAFASLLGALAGGGHP